MAVRLDDIDYFLAVVRQGQVRRAAVDLRVSQPAITKGIQRLEKELGFPLFERTSRGMRLTAAAAHLHERVGTLRANLGEAIQESADMHLGALGVLRVGVSPIYVHRVFIPACLQLHRQRPAARLVVNINLNDVLLAALRRGEIDLCISAVPTSTAEDLQVLKLLHDDLCMVVREGHPLLSRRRLRMTDLAQAQWMLPGPAVAARRGIEAVYAQAGLPPPRVAIEISNSAPQLMELLLHSDLVGVASEAMLARGLGGQLVPLPFKEARFPRQIGVVTRRGVALPPLAQRFLEVLQQFREEDEARDNGGQTDASIRPEHETP